MGISKDLSVKKFDIYRIKVQSKLSPYFAVFISLVIGIGTLWLIYHIYTADYTSLRTRGDAIGLIFLIGFFIQLILKNAFRQEEYLANIVLTDTTMFLEYKQGKNKRMQELRINDIASVEVIHNSNIVRQGKSAITMSNTEMTIIDNKGKVYFINETPSPFDLCSHTFILKLLDISDKLPNFTYELKGNNKVEIEDIKYYAKFKQRLPFKLRTKNFWRDSSKKSKIANVFVFILMFISISLFIFSTWNFILPAPKLSPAESEYLEHFNVGYKYFQDGNYDSAINEYNKAESLVENDVELYTRKAWCYQYMGNHEEAIKTAKKALSYPEKLSTYKKANRYHFSLNSDISLYTVIGESSLAIGNYDEGKEAFDYVIKHVKYKYTDAYFYRGQCEYYLREKSLALNDFERHKSIIMEYLEEQATSEFKDKYPRYKKKNLVNIDKWIDATNNL